MSSFDILVATLLQYAQCLHLLHDYLNGQVPSLKAARRNLLFGHFLARLENTTGHKGESKYLTLQFLLHETLVKPYLWRVRRMGLQNQYLTYAYDFATYLTYRLGSLLQQCQSSRLSFSQSQAKKSEKASPPPRRSYNWFNYCYVLYKLTKVHCESKKYREALGCYQRLS